MRPTLRQLEYLRAVADTGKFGEAAKATFVSQPSLSAQIADMEAYLGVTLIERGRRGATLTPAGELVLDRARIILNEVERLKSVARLSSDSLTGRIKLGVLPSVGPYLLPVALSRLHKAYPDLRLAIEEQTTAELHDALRQHELDLIISTDDEFEDEVRVPLITEDFYICVPPDHALADSRKAVTLEDLNQHTLITLGTEHRIGRQVHALAELAHAHVSEDYKGTSLDAIRQMAAMGAGIAIVPELYARIEAARDKTLIIRRLKHQRAVREIAMFWRRKSPLDEAFSGLAQTLRESIAELRK